MPDPSSTASPARTMSVWAAAAIGVGSMVGAGIFALLGQVAVTVGHETWLAFVLAGVVAAFSGYSYARLAAHYPSAGGITSYFDHAFGGRSLSGTLSLIYLLTLVVTVAMVAKAFGAYAARLFLDTTDAVWVDVFASGIVILLAVLNLAGADRVGRAELALVAVKLSILVVLMVVGLAVIKPLPTVEQVHPTFHVLVGSVGLTFFAYAGYGMITNAAGSVRDPEKTIPRAIYLAISIVTVLYIGLAIVVTSAVPPARLLKLADTALAVAAEPVLGRAGFIVVSLGALMATASAINATLFAFLRIGDALAESEQLPRRLMRDWIGNASAGYILAVAGILIMVNWLSLNAAANIASAVFLIIYLAVHVAHWRLVRETRASKPLIVVGAFLMAGVLGVFLWTLAVTQPWSLAVIVAAVGGSAVVEVIQRPKPRTT